jgi:hypothetical protein
MPAALPSVAELIRDYGQKVNRQCSLCRGWTLVAIGRRELGLGFQVCTHCDTNSESRRTAKLEVR